MGRRARRRRRPASSRPGTMSDGSRRRRRYRGSAARRAHPRPSRRSRTVARIARTRSPCRPVTRQARSRDPGPVTAPAWSPDGTAIAFARSEPPYGIYVMGADGRGAQLIPGTDDVGGSHPTWSPDGSRLAFDAGERDVPSDATLDIYTVGVDGIDVERRIRWDVALAGVEGQPRAVRGPCRMAPADVVGTGDQLHAAPIRAHHVDPVRWLGSRERDRRAVR